MLLYLFIWLNLVFQLVKGLDTVNPSFKEVISLKSVWSPVVSPDGKTVLFQTQQADWEQNYFTVESRIMRIGNKDEKLSKGSASSRNASFSHSGKWIAYLKEIDGRNQIFIRELKGSVGFQLTFEPSGINSYRWSPVKNEIAFLTRPQPHNEAKSNFYVEDEFFLLSSLKIIAIDNQASLTDDNQSQYQPRLIYHAVDFKINFFEWSPDGNKMAIEHQKDFMPISEDRSNISVLNCSSGSLEPIVTNHGYDGLAGWSPSGRELLFRTHLDDTTSNIYKNVKLFKINLESGELFQLATGFDESLFNLSWNRQGIFGMAQNKTTRSIYKIDEHTGAVTRIDMGFEFISDYSFSAKGSTLVVKGSKKDQLPEFYLVDLNSLGSRKLTSVTEQIKAWELPVTETVEWKSNDGNSIQGVLFKPKNFDPSKKYPLIIEIHGGPKGTSWPQPVPLSLYPINQLVNSNCIVYQPNYRGSAGYGETHRSLNVKNFGQGESDDILSGVAYLQKQGFIDSSKMAVMGWSFGGFLSAYLSVTQSGMFKAASVGAGISNWRTQYLTTDEHNVVEQYFKSKPWSNQYLYSVSSPMSFISKAGTPTLIQHGSGDKRVHITNAYELYMGLKDHGVPTKLVVFRGSGHRIVTPRERLAAMEQNWDWIDSYLQLN